MKKFVHNQHGMILWITMVILFVMLISAVGLIKTSDVSTQTSGNFVFRQAGVSSSDAAMQTARDWLVIKLNGGADTFGCGSLDADCAAAGYNASFSQPNAAAGQTWESFWQANQASARNLGTDAAGNTLSFIIQRMCNNDGGWSAAGNSCITQILSSTGGTEVGGKSVGVDSIDASNLLLHYSIIVRVDGPRGASTMVQSIVQGPAGG
jgi:type IV pilus assembly protein PilX